MFTPLQVSHVRFYVSHVRYRLSCVMCPVSGVMGPFLLLFLYKVVEGLLSIGPTPSSFYTFERKKATKALLRIFFCVYTLLSSQFRFVNFFCWRFALPCNIILFFFNRVVSNPLETTQKSSYAREFLLQSVPFFLWCKGAMAPCMSSTCTDVTTLSSKFSL